MSRTARQDSQSDELQSAWLYDQLVPLAAQPAEAELYRSLAAAAREQAAHWGDAASAAAFRPSWRARFAARVVRRFGIARSRSLLVALKLRGFSAHHPWPKQLEEIGARHSQSGGSLRAAVFGINDGLVSNASLLLGVAGAGGEPHALLLTGIAGLVAGALSMAAGEYLSMQSQREFYEHQIGLERAELAEYPEEEAEELALIYQARGLSLPEARALARRLIADPQQALQVLAREELGIDPDQLGSPLGAALASFGAFAFGASLPLVPYLLAPWLPRGGPVWISLALTGAALVGVGALLSIFTGRPAWRGAARMLLIGGGAGALAYAIGTALGAATA